MEVLKLLDNHGGADAHPSIVYTGSGYVALRQNNAPIPVSRRLITELLQKGLINEVQGRAELTDLGYTTLFASA